MISLDFSEGYAPWSPNSDTRNLEVWLADDFPTAGKFHFKDSQVVFILDEDNITWKYKKLNSIDIERSSNLETIDEFIDFLSISFNDITPDTNQQHYQE